jgi:4-hydroxymandelate oxidase
MSGPHSLRFETRAMLVLRDFEAEARRRLDPVLYDFFAGGAGDEVTMQWNEEAFAAVALVPRVLRGAATRSLEITLLGCRSSMPVLLAPTAFHRLAHPDGERATARAAAAAGIIMIVSMASTVAIAEVAAAARQGTSTEPHLWFQLYIQPDLEFTEAIIRCAEAAGCTAIVVTVDSPVLGRRERDLRNGFVDLPPGLCCENLRDRRTGHPGVVRSIVMSPDLSWQHIEWLRRTTALPIVLKGVLHPADAMAAVQHGIDAIVVSNHGGRQLDTTVPTIEQLPEIATAVDGRVPILLDGGVRRGSDIVKALALGASAVAVGRPVIWGLVVDGEAGVSRVLEMLRAELEHTLALCGCASLGDIGRDLARLRPRGDRCC